MLVREKRGSIFQALVLLGLFSFTVGLCYEDHQGDVGSSDQKAGMFLLKMGEFDTRDQTIQVTIYHDPELKCAYPNRTKWLQPFFTWYEVLQQECDALGKLLV